VPFYVCIILAFGDLIGRLLISPVPHSNNTQSTESKQRILTLLKSPKLAIVSVYIVIASLQASAVEASLVRHLFENFKLSPFGISMFLLSWIIPSIIFSILGGRMSDVWDRYAMLKGSLLASCVVVFMLAFTSLSFVGFVVACACFGVVNSLLSAPTLPEVGHIVNALGNTSYGTAYGVTNVCYAIGMLVGPLLGDAVYAVVADASRNGFYYLMLLQAVLGLNLFALHTLWSSYPRRSR
jgi:predicted MFS family arabinose efflux permease